MILSYKHTRESLINALINIESENGNIKKEVDKILKIYKIYLGIISFLVVAMVMKIITSNTLVGILLLGAGAIVIVTSHLTSEYNAEKSVIQKIKSSAKKDKKLLGATNIEVKGDKIIIKRENEKNIITLNEIDRVLDDGDMVYIENKSHLKKVIIPYNAFKGDKQKQEFISLISKENGASYEVLKKFKRTQLSIMAKVANIIMIIVIIVVIGIAILIV